MVTQYETHYTPKTKSSTFEGIDWLCTFGYSEAEDAARVILRRVLDVGSWDVSCTWQWVPPTGMLLLVARGYLVQRPCSAAHDEWVPSEGFIARIEERFVPPQGLPMRPWRGTR
jgi:hypothetical protein